MEGAHRELGARLADRLGGNHADRLAGVDQHTTSQIAAIALGAQTVTGIAGQRRTHAHFVDAQTLDLVDRVFVEHDTGFIQRGLGLGMDHIAHHDTTEDAIAQGFDHLAAFDECPHGHTVSGAAVVFDHHQILGHVDQSTGQVAGVGSLERGIGQAFSGAVRRDEVLQNVQTFAEVRGDRGLDDRAVRLGHQAAHAGELTDLCSRAASTRVGHHVDGIEGLLIDHLAVTIGDLLGLELIHHGLADFVAGLGPDVDHLVVTLALGHQTRGVLLLDLLDLGLGSSQQRDLLRRHQHVTDGNRDAGTGGQTEAVLHQLIDEDDRVAQTATTEGRIDQARNFFFLERLVDELEGHAVRQDLGQDRAADRGVGTDQSGRGLAGVAVAVVLVQTNDDLGAEFDLAVLIGPQHLGDVGEHHAFALAVGLFAGGVVQTQHDVLRRHDRGFAVGRKEHIVGGQHQRAGFELCLDRQRHVNRHLVAVEVGVEGRAHQRMQLDRLAFDQHRLESLDAEAVQGRCPVEHDRMFADDFFQDVPDDGFLVLDELLGLLDGGRYPHRLELVEDEGLEELERHQLGQTALMQLELRADHDDRAARVVDALAQQVLTETAALALDHVGQRLQGALVGAGHGLAATTVVEQRVNRFLQHALFIAHDDLGRLELEQTLETVVAVDDPAIEIVQVGGGKTSAIERHQRAQFGRQHRQDLKHHPLGLDARTLEALEHLQALGELLDLGFRRGRAELFMQPGDIAVDVDRAQQIAHAFGTHDGAEVIAVLFGLGEEIVFGEQLAALERGHARLDDHIGLEIEHPLDVAQRHVEHHAQTRRQRLQEPDVRGRAGQFDMAHPLAANLGERDFDAALLTDHTTVLQALVLAAQALVVLDRPEDLGAEQTVAFGLEGSVVDGLRLLDFAIGPGADLLGRCNADLDRVEVFFFLDLLEQVEQCFHLGPFIPISCARDRYRSRATGFLSPAH